MNQTKTISVPRETRFNQRLRQVGSEVRKWIRSVEKDNELASENLRLLKIEKNRKAIFYHYGVLENLRFPRRVNPDH